MSWLVNTIQECLHDNPSRRPTAQHVLSVLESGDDDAEKEHMKLSRLELVQAIESEREEHTEQRMRQEREFQCELNEREKEVQLAADLEFGLLMEEKEKEFEQQKARELGEVIAQMEKQKEEAVQVRESEIVDELSEFLVAIETGKAQSGGWLTGCGQEVTEALATENSIRVELPETEAENTKQKVNY